MFAELVINIEAPLENTFHYHVPFDLQERVKIGQLVEVEFGRKLAQAIIIKFWGSAPISETKPIISIIDSAPVVRDYQIELAKWLSETYLAPLNGCMRQLLPPGLTRWADNTYSINPYWNGEGLRTDVQEAIVALLREKGDLRGRQIQRAMPKKWRKKWKTAAQQLSKRDILWRGSVLETPRSKPKKATTATLITDPERIRDAVVQLGRSNKSAEILEYLYRSDDPLPTEQNVLFGTGALKRHLQKLEDDGLIERVPAKTFTVKRGEQEIELEEPAMVGLAIRPKEVLGHVLRWRGAQKYHAILTYLAEAAQPVQLSKLYKATGTSRTYLNKLEKLDLIRYGTQQVWRDSLADRDFVTATPPTLTHDQARAWGRIKVAMLDNDPPASNLQSPISNLQPPTPFLLHGVTGSGKTEIYMRAIELALAQGQTAIVLVPEIALTPQTVRRFSARFPGRVAMLHSRLSDGERYDTWRRARQGMFDIIVGPRSALFTPLPNLGVIVVDEEHDSSYKQGPPIPPPYYHARDAAIALGKITGAIVILGSATPDLVTYHRAQADEYQLLALPKRVMGHQKRVESQAERVGREAVFTKSADDPDETVSIPLPPIQVVDLRQELRAGNRTIFSRALQDAVDVVLENREQAILFLNRRGTATYVFCRDCGHRMQCPNCDTPLTYHRPNAHLRCHYCGHNEPQPSRCPDCGSKRIKYFGLGTEQLEELVRERWPSARTVRWDRDTTKGRDKHEELLAQFVNHEADILIGTQMIAKGLDLPLVTLVGVISADTTLGMPDYRTGERTFQVLTQVAGRAGRGILGGRVILQTYQPDHYAIQAAADHDYVGFYLDEIRFRTQHLYPPFRRMAKLVYADPAPHRAQQMAEEMAKMLRAKARELGLGGTEVVGPVPPFFGRIDRRYRWQIVVRSADPTTLLREITFPPRWVVDVDPVSTL